MLPMKNQGKETRAEPVSHTPANLILRGGRMTKWKGRAASMSPHIGALSSGTSLAAVAAVMALGGGLLLAPTASAQTLPGAQTTTITLTDTPLVVLTDNSFSIVTTSGEALSLDGTNGTSFTDSTPRRPLAAFVPSTMALARCR